MPKKKFKKNYRKYEKHCNNHDYNQKKLKWNL